MLGRARALATETILSFIADEAMTRGAAIACYTMFSIAPLLVVAVAIAGLFFGEAAVSSAVAEQLVALVGHQGAEAVQAMIQGTEANGSAGSRMPALVSAAILLITASGVFAELQAALNAIWRVEAPPVTVSYLVRARLLSIGLVAASGFLLLVSLIASAILAAVGRWAGEVLPILMPVLAGLNLAVSFLLTAVLFAAIYKVLPDRRLRWRDVAVGALGTAVLFTIGKTVIGWYIGGTGLAARYGAAGALVVVLLWVYYSAQVFLLGAEFTRAWTGRAGKRAKVPGAHAAPQHGVG
jgi:membrane protein